MHAVKLGMKDFIEGPKEYFHLENDCLFTIEFQDMHRLLRCKDLDMAQVTIFALKDAIICKQRTRWRYYLPISYAYYPKGHYWVRYRTRT